MNEQSFVDRRDFDWRRLRDLTDKIDGRGIKSLSELELREYLKLYRRASTDLALVRTKSRNPGLIGFLNDLVARAYSVFYRAPRPAFGRAVVETIATAAQTVRRRKWFIFSSAAIFFGSWILVFALMSVLPETKEIVVGPQADAMFEGWTSGNFEERSTAENIQMNAMYASNNPMVAIVAGTVGAATMGLFTIQLLFNNGALTGALSYECWKVNRLDYLLSSIFPHGVPEISGAIIAGGAGLLLGYAFFNPGRRRRIDSLKAVGKDAVTLIGTSVILMFIAAPIEAYFSFNPVVPGFVKTIVGTVSLIGWLTFWTFFARSSPEEEAIESEDALHLPSVSVAPR
jgi:uncharacterized membrane protein SpoIIM required for sporulation